MAAVPVTTSRVRSLFSSCTFSHRGLGQFHFNWGSAAPFFITFNLTSLSRSPFFSLFPSLSLSHLLSSRCSVWLHLNGLISPPGPLASGLLPLLSSSATAVTPSVSTPVTSPWELGASASLAPLLAAANLPLPSVSTGPPPLSLSLAFAPIPGKALDKIRNGSYIDFKELLFDNVELVKRLRELGASSPHLQVQVPGSISRMREIKDPLTWVRCFLLFLAARVDHQETRDLVAYTIIVINLAWSHSGCGWLSYDALFRQLKAAGGVFPWTEVNSSVMASTLLSMSGNSQGLWCRLCFASGHTASTCALFSLEQKPSVQEWEKDHPSTLTGASQANNKICHRFNKGSCHALRCCFEHACSSCQKPRTPSSWMSQHEETSAACQCHEQVGIGLSGPLFFSFALLHYVVLFLDEWAVPVWFTTPSFLYRVNGFGCQLVCLHGQAACTGGIVGMRTWP